MTLISSKGLLSKNYYTEKWHVIDSPEEWEQQYYIVATLFKK